jgi:hypothetical protein
MVYCIPTLCFEQHITNEIILKGFEFISDFCVCPCKKHKKGHKHNKTSWSVFKILLVISKYINSNQTQSDINMGIPNVFIAIITKNWFYPETVSSLSELN